MPKNNEPKKNNQNNNDHSIDPIEAEYPERTPGKMGASKKLTPARRERILYLLREGNYIETTAKACGVCSMSIHRWIRFGREIAQSLQNNKDKNPKDLNKEEKWYLSFYNDVVQAQAEAEASLVNTIKNAAEKNWVAAMTLLERRHPERWGKREKIEHSGETKNNVDLSISGLSLGELRSLAKLNTDDESATDIK